MLKNCLHMEFVLYIKRKELEVKSSVQPKENNPPKISPSRVPVIPVKRGGNRGKVKKLGTERGGEVRSLINGENLYEGTGSTIAADQFIHSIDLHFSFFYCFFFIYFF